MKLITAIAALALVAGSMDVEAQKRGKVGMPGGSDDDAPQIAPVAHLAIGAFGTLDREEGVRTWPMPPRKVMRRPWANCRRMASKRLRS